MKNSNYKRACIRFSIITFLLSANINSLVVYGEEITDSEFVTEESVIPVEKETTLQTNIETNSKEMSEQQEDEIKSANLNEIIVPIVDANLKNSIEPRANNAGAFQVEGGTGWTYSNNTLTFNKSGTYTVIGDGNQTSDKIVVSSGFSGQITIRNVNINSNSCAFSVDGSATLTLVLDGTNTLESGEYRAGLEFNNATTGSLTIDSSTMGFLTAIGGREGAGIGGTGWNLEDYSGNNSGNNSGDNITIMGGNILAKSSSGGGAGIGGGVSGSSKNIIISNGNVIAQGSDGGAGIGGGGNYFSFPAGSLTNLNISGGTVTAISKDGYGIGDGNTDSAQSENLIISGGSVKASSISMPAITGTPTDNKKIVSILRN